jgi:hypothetical protein
MTAKELIAEVLTGYMDIMAKNYKTGDEAAVLLATQAQNAPKLARMLQVAIKGLEYSALDPDYLHPQNNKQFVAARHVLTELNRIAAEGGAGPTGPIANGEGE